jgi:hypothetical protein
MSATLCQTQPPSHPPPSPPRIATSEDYFRRFDGIGQERPTHYDLVVNADVLTSEQAAEVIVCAAQGWP